MKAVVYDQYGPPDVLRIEEVKKPIAGDTDVIVKVDYVGLLPYDWRYMRAKPFAVRAASGWLKPKRSILGMDFAGCIDSVGEGVSEFKPGDRVFGLAPEAFAEFVRAPASRIALIPDRVPSLHASTVLASSLTALQSLRDHGRIVEGERVLVNGASGGVGMATTQLAKNHYGAHVTGICSQRNTQMVIDAGADRVVNYDVTDFTKSPERYDVIVDAVGNHPLSTMKKLLTAQGRYVAVVGKLSRMFWLALPGRKRLVSMVGKPNKTDIEIVADLLSNGVINPQIEKVYPIEKVQSAIAHQESMRVRGKLALQLNADAAAEFQRVCPA